MYNIKDTIVALATSPGVSALNVIRVSGERSVEIMLQLLKRRVKVRPNFCFLTTLYNPKNNAELDQSMVTVFLSPKSFTGENVVEYSVHGGFVVAKNIISILNDLGCRNAAPGEFSYRAFINGKLDLIQAESIAGLIDANNNINAFYSLKSVRGELSFVLEKIKKELINLVGYMEHELDFNEDEITHKTYNQYLVSLNSVEKLTNEVLNKSFLNSESSGDFSVCFAGKTNVGKSSLFNLLMGYDRSIVTSTSGTTRDTVECVILIDNIKVTLRDTAGLRKTTNQIEKQGIKKSYNYIENSDLVLFVDDKNPIKESRGYNLKNKNILYIQNKIDKNKKINNKNVIKTSCTKKQGIDNLLTCLSTSILEKRDVFLNKYSFLINKRIEKSLVALKNKLQESKKLIKKEEELAVVVSSLYISLDELTGILRPVKKDEILNNIFKGFCIGK